jgi:ubiquinone biosynthesis protein
MLSNVKHSARLLQIGWVLARHDALFGLEAAGASPAIIWVCKRFAKRRVSARKGERLAKALHALGPSFIKMGQALSTRADLIGEEIAQDLTHLQDDLPPFDSAIAIATIEAELGGKIDDFFSDFDETPIAAASIAQVHFAITKDGREVAVKVLRPKVEEAFARDVQMLLWLAHIIARKNAFWRKRFKPVQVVQTIAQTVKIELDLRYEAAAAEELKHNTRDDHYFYVPAIDWERSAKRVVCMERINGFHASDAKGMADAGINPNTTTQYAAEAFFNQVFRDGFFHADMHPGNLFVLPDGRLAPVDFGIMGRIDRQSQLHLAEILWGFLKGDYMYVARVHQRAGYIPSHVSLSAFAQACRAVGQPIMGKALSEISVGHLLGQLIRIASQFEMEVQPHLLLLQKTMMTAEGVGRSLNPDVNMWKTAEPLISQWAKDNLSPRARLKHYAKDAAEILCDLPLVLKDAKQMMDALRDQGVTLSPDSFAPLATQRARQHKAYLRLGWAGLATVIGYILLDFFA